MLYDDNIKQNETLKQSPTKESECVAKYIMKCEELKTEIEKTNQSLNAKNEMIVELQSILERQQSQNTNELNPEGEAYKTLNLQYKKQITKLEQTLKRQEAEINELNKIKKSYDLQKKCIEGSIKKANSAIFDCNKLTKELEEKTTQLTHERNSRQEYERKSKETQMVLDKAIQENSKMEEELKLLRDFAYNVDKSALDKHYITYIPKFNPDEGNKAINSLLLKLNQIKLATIQQTEKVKLVEMIIEQLKDFSLSYIKLRGNEQSLMDLLEQLYNELSQSKITESTLLEINKTLRRILFEKATAI